MNCYIITLPVALFVLVIIALYLSLRLLQLLTEIDLLQTLLRSHGISYRLPLDKVTLLIVLKGR